MKNVKINLLIMAFRNLGRHRVKTYLTVIAIVVGVALFIMIDGMLLGADIDSKRNIINLETGACKIYAKSYYEIKDELPLYEGFTGYQPLIAFLGQTGYNAAPHAVFSGTLISRENEVAMIFIGIDPELEKKVLITSQYLEEGSHYVENGKYDIVLGVKAARNLKVQVGDAVKLNTVVEVKDEIGIIHQVYQLIELIVGGIVNTPDPLINNNTAYLPLDILQGDKGILLNGKITELCIRKAGAQVTQLTGPDEEPAAVAKVLGNHLPEQLIVVGWQEDAGDFLAISTSKRTGTSTILFFLYVIVIILISNTMLMAVFERTKEIGMLRAQGMLDREIIRLFLFEAGWIGVIGSIIGILLGALLNLYMTTIGIDFSQFLEGSNINDIGYRIVGVFKSAWNIQAMITSGILSVIVSALSALYPARKAVKMSIVDTLKFE